MQFGFRFQILLFTTSERFSTKTLAYLAYKAFKAFMAFKRSRLNPFQNYRSITSFSVDWPRTIRLVYASESIFERLHHKAPGNRKPKTWHLHRQNNNPRTNTKWLTKEFYNQKSHGSSSDSALSLHDNVNHHQHNTRDQHVSTFTLIGSQLVLMVLRAQWPLGTIAQFFHFVAEEKRKTTKKKQRPFYDWATTGIPVNSFLTTNHESSLYRWCRLGNYFKITKFQLLQVERYFIFLSSH